MDFMIVAFFGNAHFDNLCVSDMTSLNLDQPSGLLSSNVVGALDCSFKRNFSTIPSTRRGRCTIRTLSSHSSRFGQRPQTLYVQSLKTMRQIPRSRRFCRSKPMLQSLMRPY